MKKILFNFSMSAFICILLGIIVSLILALLKTNHAISGNAIGICVTTLSILLFFLFGFIFSLKQKKRGLINGLALILFYLALYFIFASLDLTDTPVYLTVSRNAAILLGSLFGVNIASRNGQTD